MRQAFLHLRLLVYASLLFRGKILNRDANIVFRIKHYKRGQLVNNLCPQKSLARVCFMCAHYFLFFFFFFFSLLGSGALTFSSSCLNSRTLPSVSSSNGSVLKQMAFKAPVLRVLKKKKSLPCLGLSLSLLGSDSGLKTVHGSALSFSVCLFPSAQLFHSLSLAVALHISLSVSLCLSLSV